MVALYMRWTEKKLTSTIGRMQGPDYRRRLGKRIRQSRSDKGWSQEEFADLCGINRSYMGRIERGELNLTLDSLGKIANGLDITVSALLRGIL